MFKKNFLELLKLNIRELFLWQYVNNNLEPQDSSIKGEKALKNDFYDEFQYNGDMLVQENIQRLIK